MNIYNKRITCLFYYHFYQVERISYQDHIQKIYNDNKVYTQLSPFVNNILINREWNCLFIDKLLGLSSPCSSNNANNANNPNNANNANKQIYVNNGIAVRLLTKNGGFSIQLDFKFCNYTYDFIYDWLDMIFTPSLSLYLNINIDKEKSRCHFDLPIPSYFSLDTYWQKCFYRYILDDGYITLESSCFMRDILFSYDWSITHTIPFQDSYNILLKDYNWNRRSSYLLLIEKTQWNSDTLYYTIVNLPKGIKCLIYQYL